MSLDRVEQEYCELEPEDSFKRKQQQNKCALLGIGLSTRTLTLLQCAESNVICDAILLSKAFNIDIELDLHSERLCSM